MERKDRNPTRPDDAVCACGHTWRAHWMQRQYMPDGRYAHPSAQGWCYCETFREP